MEYRYYIVSMPNDFYMSEALFRELEKTGAPCYFNLRDSKKANNTSDEGDKVGNSTSIIVIGNDEFFSNNDLTSNVLFSYQKTSEGNVFIVQNGPITEHREILTNFIILDATKGLNQTIISSLKEAARSKIVETPQKEISIPVSHVSSENENIKPGIPQNQISVSDEPENICCRTGKPFITDLIVMEDGLSLTLQRAIRYLKGEGVPQDDERAYSLFKKAITESPYDPKAQLYFGVCSELEYGGGQKKDAVSAYEKTIELGNEDSSKHKAMLRLGMIKFEENDNEKAREIFSKVAAFDPISASYGLGLIDEAEGKFEDAVEHYSEAAELGNLPAQNALGCLYAEGKGVAQNEKKALQWFMMAANNGLTEAMVNAGMRLINYDDKELISTGESFIQEAAARGHQAAKLQMLEIEDRKIAEERKKELERKRQEQDRNNNDHGSNDNGSNDGNSEENILGAILKGIDFSGIAGYAKSRLWDGD